MKRGRIMPELFVSQGMQNVRSCKGGVWDLAPERWQIPLSSVEIIFLCETRRMWGGQWSRYVWFVYRVAPFPHAAALQIYSLCYMTRSFFWCCQNTSLRLKKSFHLYLCVFHVALCAREEAIRCPSCTTLRCTSANSYINLVLLHSVCACVSVRMFQ